MECNHPKALHQIGSDGLTHCGICWEVIKPEAKEEKPEAKTESKPKRRTKKAD